MAELSEFGVVVEMIFSLPSMWSSRVLFLHLDVRKNECSGREREAIDRVLIAGKSLVVSNFKQPNR